MFSGGFVKSFTFFMFPFYRNISLCFLVKMFFQFSIACSDLIFFFFRNIRMLKDYG